MRLSMDWLAEYGLRVDADTLAQRFTMAGLEVDAVLAAAPSFSQIVVGEVVALAPHPDADKLRVAQVNVGDQTLQIVCGAPNVAVGAKVPTALIGAVLPGDLRIKKSKLRGIVSHGMLCSARELGLSDDHAGLLILPADAPVGADVRDYLALNDTILDIDLTPNRADAFSMRGLAREAAVLLEQEADLALPQDVVAQQGATITVRNQAPASCPLYLAREIKGVDVSQATPLWLQERLRRAGVRPHDAVVDVTNYVMMSLGTPMHAFDAAQIGDEIVIRFAECDETLDLLNEQCARLDEGVLLIADAHKPLAIAGVMGGAASACRENTRDIVLEAAWFDPLVVAGKARQFALASDSAQRFERGVDYTLQYAAMALATRLIVEICGGCVHEIVADTHEQHLPQRTPITLRRAAIGQRVGREYDNALIVAILQRLGCVVNEVDGGWSVTPPTWRFDLSIEEDLIEEIVRVDGYDRVEEVLPVLDYRPREPEQGITLQTQKLVQAGFHEAITYSFIDRASHQAFFPDAAVIALHNPISATLAEMRLSLLPGLVNALVYNRNRQQQDIRLFESGNVFIPQGERAQDCAQEMRLAGVLCGRAAPEQWAITPQTMDFYDAKAVVETLLDGRGAYQATTQSYLHPGKGADVFIDGVMVGCVGALHPALMRTLGIKGGEIWLFELSAAALSQPSVSRFQALQKYPAVRRDLALLLTQDVAAADVAQVVRESVGEWLAEQFFFDQYQGERLGANKKSLALAIVLQAKDKTLQDEEVERIIADLVAQLKRAFNAELR